MLPKNHLILRMLLRVRPTCGALVESHGHSRFAMVAMLEQGLSLKNILLHKQSGSFFVAVSIVRRAPYVMVHIIA